MDKYWYRSVGQKSDRFTQRYQNIYLIRTRHKEHELHFNLGDSSRLAANLALKN